MLLLHILLHALSATTIIWAAPTRGGIEGGFDAPRVIGRLVERGEAKEAAVAVEKRYGNECPSDPSSPSSERSQWAGAQQIGGPSQVFESVTTDITVPILSIPPSAGQQPEDASLTPSLGWSMLAFAAIGNTQHTGIFQAGIMPKIEQDGSAPSCVIWYSWMTTGSQSSSDNVVKLLPEAMAMSAGDAIRVTLNAHVDAQTKSATTGDVLWTNLTTGKSYGLSAGGSPVICTSVSAVLEDAVVNVDDDQYYTPLADGSMAFANTAVCLMGGSCATIAGTMKSLSTNDGCTTRATAAWLDESRGDFSLTYTLPTA